MLDIGRIAVKIAGREAGRLCVVVKEVDENYVIVTGPKSLTKVKRRRCNIQHLLPLQEKISIHSDAPDPEVLKLCKGVMEKNQTTKPVPAAPEAKHEEAKKEEKKEEPRKPEHKKDEHKHEHKKVEHKHEEKHKEHRKEEKHEHREHKEKPKEHKAKKPAPKKTAKKK